MTQIPMKMTLAAYEYKASGRLAWADIAKAISIILLILWHGVGSEWYFNQLFIHLRMPLFFLTSGIFALSALRMDWRPFLNRKIGNFLYLFVLWSLILFVITQGGKAMLIGKPVDFSPLLNLFWQPPMTLWFIYALAISFVISKLLMHRPYFLVLVASLVLFTLSMLVPPAEDLPFYHKILRLFPFFWIGLGSRALITHWLGRVSVVGGLLLFGVYLAGAALLLHEPAYERWGGLVFVISVIGIGSVLIPCRGSPASRTSSSS